VNSEREQGRFRAAEFRATTGSAEDQRKDGPDARSFDRLLDRLVDGELTSSEYRSFVKSLDECPDGWRRCGLAFLESQAWRQDISVIRTSEAAKETSRGRSTKVWGHVAVRWSAIAASWLAALSIGVWWSSPTTLMPRNLDPFWADNVSRSLPSVTAPAMHERVAHSNAASLNQVGGLGASPSGEALVGGEPAGEVEFVMAGDHGDWQISKRLPLRSSEQEQIPEANTDFWSTPQVVELLRRSGREVNRQQEMVPFDLPDGRQILMPVEKVEVKPVRMSAY